MKWSSPHSQQKSLKCSTWVQSQKQQNNLCFHGKPFNITGIQVYAPITNAKDAQVEWLSEDLQDLLELTPKKDVLFIIGNKNAKVGSQDPSPEQRNHFQQFDACPSIPFCAFGHRLGYCDNEWFALEMNRDHSVVYEIGTKCCISDSCWL